MRVLFAWLSRSLQLGPVLLSLVFLLVGCSSASSDPVATLYVTVHIVQLFTLRTLRDNASPSARINVRQQEQTGRFLP